jgi:hypothetical protein
MALSGRGVVARCAVALALGAMDGCTVVPPPPPLVAIPGPSKTQAAFEQDDAACRATAFQAPPVQAASGQAASNQAPSGQPGNAAAGHSTGGATMTPPAAALASDTADPMPPGLAYLGCMATRNNIVEALPIAPPAFYGVAPAYPVYAGFGDYYPFLYGDSVGVGFYGGFGGGYRGGYGGGFRDGYGGGFRGGYGGGGYGRR